MTIDTMRADRLTTAGVTPTLDQLGHEGTVFLDATAHAPLTLPSHASILTGRYPPAHGVHDNAGFALNQGTATVATLFHAAGYHTAAFVSSYVLRRSTGLSAGFDEYNDRFEGGGRAHVTVTSLERRGPETAREVETWLAQARRPFFLWVHLYDPHAPYDPPPAFRDKYPGRPYDAEVAVADFAVSTVLNAIPANRRGETVIAVTGDHGESLGEHGESEHGVFLYDATLHVPLILQGRGVPPGRRVTEQVRHVDLLPTLLDLAGVDVSRPALDGQSLVPLLAGHARPSGGIGPNASYAESQFGALHFGWASLRSLRDGEWKYIAAPKPELYDLRSDVVEHQNRYSARPDTAAGMARVLGGISPPAAATPTPAAAADAAERLRSLGYVSGRVALDADSASGMDPKDGIAQYEQYVKTFNAGLAHLEKGEQRAAETVFRGLAKMFPRAFEAHEYLARALALRRDFAEAIREIDLAIALAPREPELYFDAARILADAAQFDKAFARVAEGRRLDTAAFEGVLTEALVARAAGQLSREEERLQEAVQINPSSAVVHLELGRIAAGRGDRDRARTEFRLALENDPTLDEARRGLEQVDR